eukprot:CAMPEP_0176451698 /NCGR_PEP_ID=MMETSP0127-20121128/28022_1 /TAXON_ID=938130 /ORGANISM="Platyophrya macrostoma, Strain WH" /LENGTH=465 /DNA_ID=CAMNT_0017839865 /DNA_START=31 /DNA_END=1428 /DNA_ORIENTATION=+
MMLGFRRVAIRSSGSSLGRSEAAYIALLNARLSQSSLENSGAKQSSSPEPALSQASDESLLFLRKPQTAKPLVRAVPLPEGCIEAPTIPDRPKREPVFVDEHARRLHSTSVGAGRPLVSETGRQFFAEGESDTSKKHQEFTPERSARRRTPLAHDVEAGFTTFSSKGATESDPPTRNSEEGTSSGNAGEDGLPARSSEPTFKKSKFEQIREAIQKLEYYEGTPQYSEMLREFREKYSAADIEGAASETEDKREYNENEVAAGLKGEPLDIRRASAKLQSRLVAGPHQFHPLSVLQQQGVGLHEGYAFNPSVELGNFKLDPSLASQSLKDQVAGGSLKDTSIAFRYFGVTDVQRRQMRRCLSDIDTRDMNTCMHVMLTYPHTDSLFFIYCALTIVFLFQMQKRFRMYDFYDEYLGLDLRQVRRLEKPLLLVISVAMVMTLLLQPLILSSIATTRIYRILMRRPVGP